MFAGNLSEAENDAREAIRVAEMTGNLWGQSYSRGVLSQTLIAFGRFGEAIAEATASIELGKRAGFSISQIWTPCVIAECLCELGQPERGLEMARGAVQAADSFLASWRGFPLAVAVICLAATGDCAAADKAAEEARLAASTLDLSSLMYGVAAIEHARACGEPETLLRRVDDGIGRLQGFGFEIYHPTLLSRKSEGHQMLGQFAQAESSARDALGIAQRAGSHRGLWRTWAALANALGAQGRDVEAREATTRAREEIAYAAEQAGREDLRRSFMALPAVRALLEES
jgi:tetratricopeptide (TPR) repeat protein